jgi:hypothetical protein
MMNSKASSINILKFIIHHSSFIIFKIMKKIYSSALVLVMGCVLTMFIAQSCKPEDIFKDTNVFIGNEVLFTAISIQAVDADIEAERIPEKMTVEITGRDKDKIFSPVGEKIGTPDGNIINLAIRRSDIPTENTPLIFTVIIKAEGYLDGIRNFTIGNGKSVNVTSIRLVSTALDAQPQGITMISKDVPVNNLTGVAQDIVLTTPNSNLRGSKSEAVTAKIKAGTKFLDKSGTALSGTASIRLTHFDAVNESSVVSFPAGLNADYVVDSTGKQIPPGQFTTAGFIAFDMTVGGIKVDKFSQPLDMSMDINNAGKIRNPETNQAVKAGDSISVWSLNESFGVWQQEQKVKIVAENGGLKAQFSQKHLSWWNIDFITPYLCNSFGFYGITNGFPNTGANPFGPIAFPPFGPPSTITFHSNIKPTQVCSNGTIVNLGTGIYYAEIIDAWTLIPIHAGYYDDFLDGSVATINNYLGGGMPSLPLKLRIWSGTEFNRGTQVFLSAPFTLCSAVDLTVTLPNFNNQILVDISVTGICTSTTGEVSPVLVPTLPMYYREDRDKFWSYLGAVANGKGCTAKLQKGGNYEFGIFYGTLSRTTEGKFPPLPLQDAAVSISSAGYPTPFTIDLKYANNRLNLAYQNFLLPDKLCTEYKKYFK